ncbi:MAG: hypothetical protein MUF49_13210 [Oculatellaceae cyanobacterium Prado106]|jgi:hypothetical protein|nr:hypothetical protein [Oculatellaceae cyanobacterium Prado106]
MNPNMLRQFWSLIEQISPEIPLSLDDNTLTQWLLRQMRSQRFLSQEEARQLDHYIHDRLPLIREW